MTSKEKIKKIFFENPERLKLKQIENLFLSEGFEIKEGGRGSHKKLLSIKTNKVYIYPVHSGEVKKQYKKEFLKFYNLNK